MSNYTGEPPGLHRKRTPPPPKPQRPGSVAVQLARLRMEIVAQRVELRELAELLRNQARRLDAVRPRSD